MLPCIFTSMIALKTEKTEHAIHICMTCFHSLPRDDNGIMHFEMRSLKHIFKSLHFQVLKMLLLCKWMTKMHTKCLAENSVV